MPPYSGVSAQAGEDATRPAAKNAPAANSIARMTLDPPWFVLFG
jgi:hypothetical protein